MKPIRRSDGKCYNSATEAAREMVAETGVGNLQTALANITAVARGDCFRKSAYGYGWEYCEPLGDAYDEALRKIAALERENTDLRMMTGAAKMRVGLLESLVKDMYGAWCATVDDYYAENIGGYYERMTELGIEVDA